MRLKIEVVITFEEIVKKIIRRLEYILWELDVIQDNQRTIDFDDSTVVQSGSNVELACVSHLLYISSTLFD